MKISKKLKWGLGLVGLTAMAVVPMSVALSSCSSGSSDNNDNNSANGGVVDENGIIQPLSKIDITPTQFNFDNRLTSNTAEIKQVNSLEEANQILNDKWNALSDEQKIACIKNDIQNWLNFYLLNNSCYTETSFLNKISTKNTIFDNYMNLISPSDNGDFNKNWNSYSDELPNVQQRVFPTQNSISKINFNNNVLNISIEQNECYQQKFLNSKNVESQVLVEIKYNFNNLEVQPKLLLYNNQYLAGFFINTTNNSTGNFQYLKTSNWIINESTGITEYEEKLSNDYLPYDFSLTSDIVPSQNLIYGATIPSPYLNMIFEINNNGQN